MKQTINHVAFNIIKSTSIYHKPTANKFNSLPYKVKDVKAEIERIIKLQESRKQENISFRSQFWAKYKNKADKIAAAIPNMGYSMGQYNKVVIKPTKINTTIGHCDNTTEYAKSSKYSAKHGYTTLPLSAKEFLNTKIIGGLITIFNLKIARDLYKCQWVRSKGEKQYFQLVKFDGYIFRDFHFIAANDKAAKQIAKDKKESIIQAEITKNAEKKIQDLAASYPFNRIFVEVNDSTNAGNCLPGTENFAQKNGIDLSITGAVRADFLYERRNGSEVFVLRAINAAKIRYAKNGLLL